MQFRKERISTLSIATLASCLDLQWAKELLVEVLHDFQARVLVRNVGNKNNVNMRGVYLVFNGGRPS